MPERKLILVADPDREVLKVLGNAFHEQGYDVRAARDGSRALEKAILVHPDLVLFDADCALIPPKKYIRILRSNPRTENIPVIIMGVGEEDDSALWGYREAFIQKPFHPDEVLGLVGTVFRRMATARQVREGGTEIEGRLGQIALVDLLQIFKLNSKTGLLEVELGDLVGQVFVADGNVVHAGLGRHRSEKALFRMLQWKEGSFAFMPEQVTSDLNIRRSTDMLLIEGARQSDELELLLQELPAGNARLAADQEVLDRFEGLHPVTQQILSLLEFYHTVDELVEHSRVSDYETCRAIRTLFEKGALRALEEVRDEPPDELPMLSHDLLYELKVRLARHQSLSGRTTHGKLGVICPSDVFLKALLTSLRRLPGFELGGQVEALRFGFGQLGQLALSENLVLDLMLLPAEDRWTPLWAPLAVGLSAGLVAWAGPKEQIAWDMGLMADRLRREFDVPVFQVAAGGAASADGVTPLDPADPAAVRQLMVDMLVRLSGQPDS